MQAPWQIVFAIHEGAQSQGEYGTVSPSSRAAALLGVYWSEDRAVWWNGRESEVVSNVKGDVVIGP